MAIGPLQSQPTIALCLSQRLDAIDREREIENLEKGRKRLKLSLRLIKFWY